MSVTVSYAWPGATASPSGGKSAGSPEPLHGNPPVQAAGAARLPWLQILAILIASLALAATVSNVLLVRQAQLEEQRARLEEQRARLEEKQRAASLAQAAYEANLRTTQLFCAQIGTTLRSQTLLNPSPHPSAMALDVEGVVGLCDNVRRQLEEISLRDLKRSVSPGSVSGAAARPASTPAAATTSDAGAFDRDSAVNDIVETSGDQLANIQEFVDIVAGGGPLKFKKHVDDPSENELRKSVGPGVVGMGLLAFPTLSAT